MAMRHYHVVRAPAARAAGRYASATLRTRAFVDLSARAARHFRATLTALRAIAELMVAERARRWPIIYHEIPVAMVTPTDTSGLRLRLTAGSNRAELDPPHPAPAG